VPLAVAVSLNDGLSGGEETGAAGMIINRAISSDFASSSLASGSDRSALLIGLSRPRGDEYAKRERFSHDCSHKVGENEAGDVLRHCLLRYFDGIEYRRCSAAFFYSSLSLSLSLSLSPRPFERQS